VYGVLVKGDLEGFFLIIMGLLTDTFLQDPLGNRQPIANKPILELFPSFGPMQFVVAGAFGHAARWSHLTVGLAWTAAVTTAGPDPFVP
jgi:ABC-2 type transport system permease protein